ncbi:isochorismatase family protein [Nostoc sp. KVJ3]|uniref:isochorismatase family protein n=1 Tax=Nostoc sp. KVJ3 TaxID=457945 RepID=UPI0022373F92|nr:isochorismatase family protein [Nostoc sp. KVJ3]MCW5317082.1 isochorismatase family protein [Nostoc sp. KVJ3]
MAKTITKPRFSGFRQFLKLQKNERTGSYYSAFTENFSSFILINQISKIYFCGVETDSCIFKTAIDSFERGIEPVIIEDACFSAGGQQAHDAGIFLLKRNIGKNQIQMSDQVIEKMS